jgi:glucose/arabinose dehydrogenase
VITRRRTLRLAAPLAAGVLLSACTGPSTGPAAPAPASAPDGVETLTRGLQAPWSIAFHGGTALISERDTTREVTVIDGVTPGGEGGLLGLAVHEDHLFTYATTAGGNRIERRPLTGAPGSLALGSAQVLLDAIPTAATHNGGRLAIGPDGMLYATTGDAGQRESAQDVDSLAGKILRMTPEGSVPSDNPFPGSLVYSYGHRNPQGIAWAEDGTMPGTGIVRLRIILRRSAHSRGCTVGRSATGCEARLSSQ